MSEDSDLALEALTDFLNAVESGISAARQRIKESKLPEDENLDFTKLLWQKRTGTKGEFEQTSEKANGNSDLWKKLKAKLKEHAGFWQNQGFKYWNDRQQDTVIDRRKIG